MPAGPVPGARFSEPWAPELGPPGTAEPSPSTTPQIADVEDAQETATPGEPSPSTTPPI